jgi:hypothetical protein
VGSNIVTRSNKIIACSSTCIAVAADAAQVQVWQEARLPAIAAPLLQAMYIIAAKVLLFAAPSELLHKHMHAALIFMHKNVQI